MKPTYSWLGDEIPVSAVELRWDEHGAPTKPTPTYRIQAGEHPLVNLTWEAIQCPCNASLVNQSYVAQLIGPEGRQNKTVELESVTFASTLTDDVTIKVGWDWQTYCERDFK